MDESKQQQIDGLLVEWELAIEQGRAVTVEQLCGDAPHLLPQLREGIRALEATSWILIDDTLQGEAQETAIGSPDGLPESEMTVEQIAEALQRHNILSPEHVLPLKLEHVKNGSTGKQFVEACVQKSLLNKYQAETVRLGHCEHLSMDRYLILDRLGAGGMGVVYKAKHRLMDRVVALKVLLKSALDSTEKVKRFHREIKTVARIDHPNVVTGYDAHEFNGTHFLVMELVEGNNLAEVVRENGCFPLEEAVEVVRQVATGLAEAHRQGLVHRDIKPSNIMLGDNGVAKLLDLGLATNHLFEEQTVEDRSLTREGSAMGTADYMSPEQALDAKQADARSDIYSLGCTLFFLLNGRPPYPEPTPMKTLVAHREQPIPSLLKGTSDEDQKLNAMFTKMLAKQPVDRQTSVDELLLELGGEPDSAKTARSNRGTANTNSPFPASATAEAKPAAKTASNSLVWLSLAGLLLAAIAFGGWKWWNANSQDEVQRDVAKWVLQEGGTVFAKTEFSDVAEFYDATELPSSPIRIHSIHLIDNGNIESANPIGKLTTLTLLSLDSFDTLDLQQAIGSNELESLMLYSCMIDKSSCKAIERLTKLKILDLEDSYFEPAQFSFLSQMKQLRTIDLSSTQVDLDTVRSLAKLENLDTLRLGGTQVSNESLAELPKQLRELSLDGCDISDAGIGELATMRSLASLTLNSTDVTAIGIRKLIPLQGLNDLHVAGCDIDSDFIAAINELPALQLLGLAGHTITRQEVRKLIKLRYITKLNLDFTEISDNAFLELSKIRQLEEISLIGAAVSDAAIDEFNPPTDNFTLIVSE